MTEDILMLKDAVFCPDRIYRYVLRRIWDEDKQYVNFLMLNPSVADENIDDPTVAKCQKFAKLWGYGGVVVTNIFAFRATDPQDMKAQLDPIGPENDHYILEVARKAGLMVAAWGNHGVHLNRSKQVVELLLNDSLLNETADVWLWCLKANKTGEPQHPLYVGLKTKPSGYYGFGEEPDPTRLPWLLN